MCWGFPMWSSWGVPWGMYLMPFFFFLAVAFMFCFFRRGFPSNGCHGHNVELATEVRNLRQEVEELRKEIKK